jgi:predicted Zn finger-like uncharacterized protein
MSGTTLCPNCNTRFKIGDEQLEAHHGMVRCGHCLQAFDAIPGYIPDQPHPQLELPIDIETVNAVPDAPVIPALEEQALPEPKPEPKPEPVPEPLPADTPPVLLAPPAQPVPAALLTLAEHVAILHDDHVDIPVGPPKYHLWSWAVGALILTLCAQAAYFLRVDLAARLPGAKPALVAYCQLLGCSVRLPQKASLMSIESSDLEADPVHENQITLNALLRNRAPYAQAYPNLELTLNDTLDKPIARRIFKPRDYLPAQESEQTGLLPSHELSIKLPLNINDLRPTGYRLALLYP